jgi:2,3-bisphosphoglycerate-independent phosphoglycerate mutase
MPFSSDGGTMTIHGYDPARYHAGRAPIEAANRGILLGPTDVVFHMNLASLQPGAAGMSMMHDFTSGHIRAETRQRSLPTSAANWPATQSSFSMRSTIGI